MSNGLTASTVERYFIGMAIVYVATVMTCHSLAIVSRSHSCCEGVSFSSQRGKSHATFLDIAFSRPQKDPAATDLQHVHGEISQCQRGIFHPAW